MSTVAYPTSFLERPEDRSFLIELELARVPKDAARLILYRIWSDFATGGSDRRKIEVENLAEDRQVRVLENYCEWTGEPGDLVRMAIAAGFLTLIDGDSGKYLVCAGFYPINSAFNAKGRSFQRRGGLSRVLNAQSQAAQGDADDFEKLWERTGNPFQDVPPEICRRAILLISNITRALGLKNPTNEELKTGIMRMAIENVQSTDEKAVSETLLWILSRRKDPDMVNARLDTILRTFPAHVASAASEMSH